MQQAIFVKKLTILVALFGTVLFGWLFGHILRHSILEIQFPHPSTPEIDTHIENGLELEGIRRQVVLTRELAPGVLVGEGTLYLGGLLAKQCVGNTYYTSLPAKCRSVDGNLVQVGGSDSYIIVMPEDK